MTLFMRDCKIQLPKMIKKSIMLLSLVALHSTFINGKTTCKWQFVEEWHTQPLSYMVNWTLTENICMDFDGDCWFGDVNTKMNTSGNQVVPQICPLQIQLGDILIISSEPSLESPEINLMNVSEASFIDCLQNTTTEDQLLFGCNLKGMHTVNSQWLSAGTHYFITVTASSPSLCHLGLRLNVTVKEQFCQESLSSEFCSGHGKCLTEVWSKTYSCHCEPPFFGKYCQALDPCSYKLCENNGSCITKRGKLNKQGYECIFYPSFTGINFSEIIGQRQPHICFHGNCGNITANSFICECDAPFSGPFCEKSMECYISQCCWKGEVCQKKSSAYICEYPEGFFNQNHETDVHECPSILCQNGTDCVHIANDTLYVCPPIFRGKLCKRQLQTPHESFHCKNNITCTKYEKDYHCSCLPGFTGKNCEKVIDHRRLLSINCLNEEWYFNISGRLQCVCTSEYRRYSCWFVKNVCLIQLYSCYCGSISHDSCQGSEDEKCEVAVDAFYFLSANCTEDAVSEDLDYIFCVPCQRTRELYANECKCLTEEGSKGYWCLCIPRWPGKMSLENATDYQESGCQHEAIYKDEINRSRCSCSLGYMDPFYVLNVEDCLGNQSRSVHGLCLVCLHKCNSSLQRHGRNDYETETEDCESVPYKNGAAGARVSGYFFCKCVPGSTELLHEIDKKQCDSSPCLHNITSTEFMDKFKSLCPCGFIDLRCEIDADVYASYLCKNGATRTDQPGNYFCQCMAPFKDSSCDLELCEASNPCENGAVWGEKMDLETSPLGYQCPGGKGFAGPPREINVNECSSRACLHGYCLVNGFPCLCYPGFTGLGCEQNIDDCTLKAREHNSACKDLHLSHQCVCLAGWEETFCEQESNDYKMNPCKNNSTCIDLHNSYRCKCTPGWTGQNCSEEINECDCNPCMNGGLCHESSIPGHFVCLCPPFYMGKFCHQHYNPCDPLSDLCRNNSTCLTLVDGNHCVCREGFEGEYCEINVNECLSLPCQNHGDCEDGVNNFRCVCRPGFSGPLCDLETNNCSSRPCKNNGTCVDLSNRFVCICEPGYHGSFCELDMDECEISPCLDGEDCVSKTSGYNCFCAPGYTGIDCEVNIDECLSKPCLHDGAGIDGINHYTCDCKSGFFRTHCETNANDCLSNPCLHGRCIDLISEYQCSCIAEWTSSRCEIKINNCTSTPSMNEDFCQISVDDFTCICPSGFTGAYCEIYIDSCAEPELNLVLCLNGRICVDGPGHMFYCRCLLGFSSNFCKININECSSSPCASCGDHINGYICKCQQGLPGHDCGNGLKECISKLCVHGMCIENEPGFGSGCLCISGFEACSTGLFCGAEISRITCLLPVSQRTDVISTQTYTVPASDTSISIFPSARAARLWTIVNTYPVDPGPKQTDIIKHDVLPTTSLAALSIGISIESYLLEDLISTRKLSAKHSLPSSRDVSFSQFLNFGVHDSAQIVWDKTSVSHMSIQTSAATAEYFFPSTGDKTPFIISSSMTDFIFPTESLLFVNSETIALSTTTVSSVITGIPGADIKLKRHSLLSHGFLFTTASKSAPSIVSRGAQEDIEEYSAVSLISRREYWRLLSSSMSPFSPAKIIISKQVAILKSSALHQFTTQASIPSEYQVITEASSNQRLTNIKSQAADSLSELSQTCATCSMTEIKSSHEFSDQVLHSKQSHFYETFWMNSALSASWYALMGIETITSGHPLSSATEIMPSEAFTELSSLFPSKKSTKRRILSSSLEESITLSSNLDVNLCLDKTYLSIVPSQIVSSDLMNSDLTSQLTTDDPSVSENILKLLTIEQYDITMGPTEILNQDNLLGVGESKVSHKQFEHHTHDSFLDFELTLQNHPQTIYSGDLKNHLPPYIDAVSDCSEVTSKVAFYEVSGTQSHPIQASLPVSLLVPDWTYYTDYLSLTPDLKEELTTSSERLKWELQPSVPDWESPATSQRLSITRSFTLSSLEFIPTPLQLMISGFRCFCYYGDSYLEFRNVLLSPQSNISLEFHTFNSYGLLLYIKQDSNSVDEFFIQLFVENGTLTYHFFCAGEAKLGSINTTIKVDDGQKYTLLIRQEFDPCRAELTILGRTMKASESINHTSGKPLPKSGSVFIGGFPSLHETNQISGRVENFTGCIEVTEINNWKSLIPSKAVKKIHVENCRPQDPTLSTVSSVAPTSATEGIESMCTSLGTPPIAPPTCQEDLCHNGGTCHPVILASGTFSFHCDCPLHFIGRFCEQDAGLLFPSFNGNSYLELPFFITLDELTCVPEKEHNSTVTIYLTIKTNTLNGTILYSSEKNSGQQFLHLFLMDGRPTVKYGCGSSQNILTLSANYSINTKVFVPITVRLTIPVGSSQSVCMIEVTADGKPPILKKAIKISHVPQVHFESMFLGHIPPDVKIHENAGHIYGFNGCIQELQVNNKEFFIIDEALRGKNIENCRVPWCARHLCHNNGTCTSDSENWFCKCPRLYSGKVCQFATCENSPCGNGATCVPKSRTDPLCLCPYGRSGLLCTEAINITQPRFSGTDAFGYTSFLAYSRIPDISFDYEFHLKFQLANNHSALQNNLIFFTGQKGHGLDRDDFLAMGLREGRVVYTYNLGAGTASISSDPLDLSLGTHTVRLGRSCQMGWLKVDDHKNKSIISPGRLVRLNVVSQFYVGGYSEYIPDLLPNGADFKNGFQGCIFTLEVRTEKNGHFRSLGSPEGRPNAGRSVGQCDISPCSLMKCSNGGTCMESASSVHCDCPPGWKGELCMETISTCDPEHDPPHRCSKGATCVSLPHGYICSCPLGTTGIHCEQALSISDPSFRSHELSWMSFASFRIRKKTHIQLQFQPLSADGILLYVAQHLKAQSGDFLCISLVNGSVQLRYNLGDRTIILETLQKVTINGSTWHMIKAGRVGAEGYLDLDGINVTEKANAKMSSLDTNTDFYIGGVPSLNLINPMSVANEPAGFQGCVREVIINNQELKLTELGAKGGANVGDCDGTPCGYKVCRNRGECIVNGTTFSCRCLPHWAGNTCDQSVHCSNNLCLHQSLCIPDQSFSYNCLCTLGWVGKYCENKTSFSTAKFMGNSYIKYIDPDYRMRNLQFTTISLNFSTTETEGLIVWIGKAQNEENDFLAIGLHNQSLKIAINLGKSISVPILIYSKATFCCNKWHHVSVIQNQTVIKAYLDHNLILLEDTDPHKIFVDLNYDGIIYLGGFEYGRKVNIVTREIFKRDFVGRIKDVFFQDSKKIELIKLEGYNVFNGDEQN